ncbi:MAG: FecR domain-containing protein [Deltaproteobacteria bacterium]|jgi:ferric-dicitrate binding protein FerR (iron transport regulator)|nr:FecR domain-containing protein [Deltaproteobacteria bacterium]MBW2530548.1 FecR domain-containing protein [Deltaproteobacteria bacterium]
MSSSHPKAEELARLALEGLAPAEIQQHLEACAACQAKLDRFEASLGALREEAPPAEEEPARARSIDRALDAAAIAPPTPLRTSRRPLLAAAAVVVAAAAAVVVVPRLLASGPEGWTLEAGQLAADGAKVEPGDALPDGQDVTAEGAEARIRFSDDSRVTAIDGTRFGIRGTTPELDLSEGTLEIVATPRTDASPLRVHTAEAVVTVVGTRFSVSRAGTETNVSVSEGVVEVTRLADGQHKRLGVGEMLKVGAEVPKPQASAAPTATASASATATPVRRASIADIRAQIAAGNFAEARKLISRARSQGGVSQAELAIVEAEALLAQGKGGQAAQAYLAVAESFPSTPQAEEALFAAAQLSLGRSGKGKRGLGLLRQYLARYPSGRFSAEAKRLLDAAKETETRKK